MQLNVRTLSVITLTVFTTLTACKKDADKQAPDASTEFSTHADDQARVSGEMDMMANDANTAVEGNSSFSGRVQNPNSLICDATVTADSSGGQRRITITYNGGDCAGAHIRTGVVTLSMPVGSRWREPGTVLTVAYQNVKIKRTSDNKSITINGTGTITNVSGSRLMDLATQGNITHTLGSNVTVTFDDGSQRTWQAARRRVFTYNNGIVITVTGTHTEGNKEGIAEWGTTRFGKAFVTSITQPLVIRQDCNFRLTGGQVQHENNAATGIVTFGLNATGEATVCPGTGSYYFKLAWTGADNNTYTIIHPY